LPLKFFELDARFPRHTGEIPKAAVDYMGQQVEVSADELVQYDLASRQAKRHRVQIREALGFRESSVEDEEKLVGWLAEEVCPRRPRSGPGRAGGPMIVSSRLRTVSRPRRSRAASVEPAP
jgi:hypothetical protein